MSKPCRTLLLVLAVFALAGVPASAAVPASPGDAPALDLLAPSPEAAVCKAPDAQGGVPVEPELMAQGFRGYCRCSCSLVKNCNTSADCGGSACLGGVTCC